MSLVPLSEKIAVTMLKESDTLVKELQKEIMQLKETIKELNFEIEVLSRKLCPSTPLREELERYKQTVATLMKKLERK